MPHLILAGMSPELQDGWEFFCNKEHRGRNTTLRATAIPLLTPGGPQYDSDTQLGYTNRTITQIRIRCACTPNLNYCWVLYLQCRKNGHDIKK